MSINLQIEIDKSKINNFAELIMKVLAAVLQLGCKIVSEVLEEWDREIMNKRDKKRYRCKGQRKTCIKTVMGEIEYKRRYYEDRTKEGKGYHVYLLDEQMGLNKIGLIEEHVCKIIARMICVMPYRAVAEQITKLTGMRISTQGVWNVVQEMGRRRLRMIERLSELAEKGVGLGKKISKILYAELDGLWLKLQGKDRQGNENGKELKIGIAYDGVEKSGAEGKERYTLHNKLAFSSFEDAKMFKKHLEGLIANTYAVKEITLRVLNGDGANWIKGWISGTIEQLDKFHRNQKISRCVKDETLRKELRTLLYAKDIPQLLSRIEQAVEKAEDEKEREGLLELCRYYKENETGLTSYCERGVEIPETCQPGVVFPARLGSMESNVFTLAANRMKGGRACWSIAGGNNLASLLDMNYTCGFDELFLPLPPLPIPETQDTGSPSSASKIPESVGKGNAFYRQSGTCLPSFLRNYCADVSFAELKII